MESRIARLEEVEEPRKEWALQFTIGAAPRSSSVVATLDAAVVTLRRLRPRPGLAAGRRAASGSASPGPTAPARPRCCALLLGRLAPDEGTASLGASVAVGEIDQARTGLRRGPAARPTRSRRRCPSWRRPTCARCWPSSGSRPTRSPAPSAGSRPGERTRAALALLQARGVNLLVLDEPTNHLDLPAIEQLEQALESYDGTLLLVTHDRRLLDDVRLDQRWHVEAGRVTTT